jgi:hypothetical protein
MACQITHDEILQEAAGKVRRNGTDERDGTYGVTTILTGVETALTVLLKVARAVIA